MSKGDYICLNRSLLVNDLWRGETFTRGQAWVDLLMLANWKAGVAVLKGEKVPYARGQLCRAMKQLSVRWHWSEGKVKRYLDLLRDLEQISFENWPKNGAQKRYVTTLITITNYDLYQTDGAWTERGQSVNGAPTERERSGGNKVKKVNNIFVAPAVEDVMVYMQQIGFNGDAEKFVDHYAAKGWMVGKVKMKDWKAAVRTWRKNQAEWKPPPKSSTPRDEVKRRNQEEARRIIAERLKEQGIEDY